MRTLHLIDKLNSPRQSRGLQYNKNAYRWICIFIASVILRRYQF